MTLPEPSFKHNNKVQILIASECNCGKDIPDSHRKFVIEDVIKKMRSWFNAATKIPGGHFGYWNHDDGTPADEQGDTIYSQMSDKELAKHEEDFKHLTANVANLITQAEVPCIINNEMIAYRGTFDKCLHEKTPEGLRGSLPEPISQRELTAKEKIKDSLQSLTSPRQIQYLFCKLLNYPKDDQKITLANWPENKTKLLAKGSTPMVIASHNGFKIFYLHLSNLKLQRSEERHLLEQLLQEDKYKYALFVISNFDKSIWNFINAKLEIKGTNKNSWLFRRIRVTSTEPIRTSVDRIHLLDLEFIGKNLPAKDIKIAFDNVFDVEAVAKDFYKKISNWYFWALSHKGVIYPRGIMNESQKSMFFIRLLTRLIFCWFLREKILIPKNFFELKTIKSLIKNCDLNQGTFYKVFLQNLFFSTLNQEIENRSFLKKENHYDLKTYLYKNLLKETSEFKALLDRVPFVNGGLFNCLDENNSGVNSKYFDDFSEDTSNHLCVPNELFWGKEKEFDLSAFYGQKIYKKEKVTGLLNILKQYQFTIEENTSFDHAVALDPELLGKVFENLLASFNKETRKTARKDMGAFYTPRNIVDYMTEESLINYLNSCLTKENHQTNETESQIRKLFLDKEDPKNKFSEKQIKIFLLGISKLRALDSSVGSGSFPMGLLQKLVYLLQKLDPKNKNWKDIQIKNYKKQIEAAEHFPDPNLRELQLQYLEEGIKKIESDFKKDNLNYGRKLYLIQNCLFGVDIQPIAIQITKMRFFISMIVDQKIDIDQPNLGIVALPNLDTHFVIANALVSLEENIQPSLQHEGILKKENDLKKLRERYFSTKNPASKKDIRQKDLLLRNEIVELLIKDGWEIDKAKNLSSWDPFDQNSCANFFDSEWMFGIKHGFDIVIGNPPYGASFDNKMKDYIRNHYKSYQNRFESYIYFIERCLDLANEKGVVTLITPQMWLRLDTNELLREKIHNDASIKLLNIYGEDAFTNVIVNTVISLFQKGHKTDFIEIINNDFKWRYPVEEWSKNKGFIIDFRMSPKIKPIIETIERDSVSLSELGRSGQGITPYDKHEGQSEDIINNRSYHFDHKKDETCEKWIKGNDLSKYQIMWSGEWLSYGSWLARPREDYKYLFSGERILFRELPGKNKNIQATFVDSETIFHGHSITPFKIYESKELDHRYILGLVNSQLLSWYANIKFPNFSKDYFPKLNPQDIRAIPIRVLDLSFKENHKIYKELIKIVDNILNLYKKGKNKKAAIFENKLDEIVFQIYDLTDEEINLIQNSREMPQESKKESKARLTDEELNTLKKEMLKVAERTRKELIKGGSM